jgi:hypothetical protein
MLCSNAALISAVDISLIDLAFIVAVLNEVLVSKVI